MARHTHYALPSNNLCKTESFSPDFKTIIAAMCHIIGTVIIL